MSNVLTEHQQHDIRALGRLGWSLRQIERRTGVRRETISEYLKAAGVPVRARGGRPRAGPPPNPATTRGGVHRRAGKSGHHRDGVHRPGGAAADAHALRERL